MEQGKVGHVIELAVFKLKDGVTRDQLMATVDPVSQWAKRQPGFVSRDLTYSADGGTWIDVLWWESLEAAHTAAQAAMTSEACAPMFGLIDMEATQMIHGERVAPSVARETQTV